jgi:hypothetical protein
MRYQGRVVLPFISSVVRCESTSMNEILSGLPDGLGNDCVWLWQPSSGHVLPDLNGNTGIWVLCYSSDLCTVDGEGRIVSRTPFWRPYFSAVIPFVPEIPICDTDELYYWMKLTLPMYQSGDTVEKRMSQAEQNIVFYGREFWLEVYDDFREAAKLRLRDSQLPKIIRDSFCSCDPDLRKKIQKRIALKFERSRESLSQRLSEGY